MKRYIVKRVLHAIVITWLVATTLFFGVRLLPGGPVRTMLGKQATEAKIRALREELGMNKPLHEQYIDWFVGLLQFDFGTSIRTGQAVTESIMLALPKTLSIGALAVLIGLVIAIPTGVISATRRHELPDYVATFIAFFGLSAPSFFIAILLMVIFAVRFEILPVFGYTPLSEGFVPWFQSILLPAISVALPYTAVVMRMMRSSLLEVMGTQYMRTAKMKGLSRQTRFYKHALQNALIPVVTVAGIQLAVVIGGSVTVEIVFGIKGIGRLIVSSILNRDYPVTQGVILVIASGFILINLLIDIMYTAIDPRIRYGDENA
ncbi:ABC transporter permease [Halorarius halobius]|uniref:ABC transporter permease n=1 Tax=Halorarius halobius TaxID=2962671 RepID=UPI0020CB7E55|nr:ABC transporter permease [Halorarius halobius]